MDEIKNITVAFTGHRYYSRESDQELLATIRKLYDEGYSRFLCGMSWGFDLAAGEAVLRLKEEHPEVDLIAAIPHRGFYKLFHGADAEQYRRVADGVDGGEVISEHASDASYRMRNDFLVENASVVVAWWDGAPRSGTAYTISQARRRHLRIINLFPDPQLNLEF